MGQMMAPRCMGRLCFYFHADNPIFDIDKTIYDRILIPSQHFSPQVQVLQPGRLSQKILNGL